MTSVALVGEARSSTSTLTENTALDLLQRLQHAICNGQHQMASAIAAELAKMKANCSMSMKSSEIQLTGQMVLEEPIRVQVQPDMTVSDLEILIYQKYKVPIRNRCLVLVGTTLPFREGPEGAENVCVVQENGAIMKLTEKNDVNKENWECSKCTYVNKITDRCCVICSSNRAVALNSEATPMAACSSLNKNELTGQQQKFSNYKELLNMENTDLITNLDAFECPICMIVHHPGDGVVLKTCLHSFCRDCLSRLIETSSDAEIRCPYVEDYSCGTLLQDREIRALVSAEVYDRYITVCMNEAESKIANTFHCKTPNCSGWCVFEDDVNEFICPVCQQNNCLTCQVIHAGMNCQEYQRKIQIESANDPEAHKTRKHLEDMLKKGQAMTCPTCQIIILKKNGCDALVCTICKTEICWITKGPRWGPKGRGDASGGCGCSYLKKCHPECGNCH